MPSVSTPKVIILFSEQNGKCYYCGDDLYSLAKNEKKIHIDHKIPVASGGLSNMENYCLACGSCNMMKNTKSIAEFREYLKPYTDGLVFKKDLSSYYSYLNLHERFGHIVDDNHKFNPDKPIVIAEYTELLYRMKELEQSFQEIMDKLEIMK